MLKVGFWIRRRVVPTLAVAMAAGIMLGCASKEQKALDQAKRQAVSTGQAQQVASVDKDGNTITTVVQPPAAGQKEPTMVTTTAPPAAGTAKPSPKDPTVSALREDGQDQAQNQVGTAQPGSGQTAQSQPGSGQSGSGKPSATGAPAPPPEVSIPAGTTLAIRVDQTISVKTSRPGDQFTGEVVDPIGASDGTLLVPKGARVKGRVDASHKRGHFKGSSVLELRLTSIELNGAEHRLETRDLAEQKKGKGRRSAGFIGGGAGVGMMIGGLAAGPAGVLMGGLAGGGAGTAAAGLTGNRDLTIRAESVVRFKLAEDLVVQPGQ
jgi:hypothetical protein